jgi:hypothetical protein
LSLLVERGSSWGANGNTGHWSVLLFVFNPSQSQFHFQEGLYGSKVFFFDKTDFAGAAYAGGAPLPGPGIRSIRNRSTTGNPGESGGCLYHGQPAGHGGYVDE